jgi:tRNA A-37 threonylcarbamoyl transferase component Bud32
MKTLTKTLSIDSRFLHLYRPLVRRLVVVLIVTALLALAALLFFDERLVTRMSSSLIGKTSQSIEENLKRRLGTNKQLVGVALDQVDDLALTAETKDETLFERLAPFVGTYPMLDSINFADAAGNEFVVIRDEDGFLTRRIDAETPGTTRWRRWREERLVETWERDTEASPMERPWFVGAMHREPGTLHWTEPYEFLTTREPGISISTRGTPEVAGPERVLSFNLSLTGISEMTMNTRPSENGVAFVFDDEGRTIGLPADERYPDDRSIAAAELLPLEQLGIPLIDRAIAAWSDRDRGDSVFSFSGPSNKRWWAGLSRVELDEEHAVWSAVLVPRSDLLGTLVTTRNLAVLGIIGAGALVAGLMFLASMRSIRRQMREVVDRIEQKLGQYHVEEKIGEGGNGTVYRAKHALLRRPTALKLMNPEFARSEAARKRFEHEVRLTSGLSHPNTIAIYDFGHTDDGTLYYAMELLEGSTLDRLVRASGPLPANRAIHLLVQACGSLAEAHAKGLIHRDIKPSNLIVCERGGEYDVVKVLDFGLVKEMAQVDGNLTQANVLIGTPFYMAPEIISQPGAASPQSDLYALGAVGYYLVTSRQVFEGESAVEICAAHLHDEPERPSDKAGRDVPRDLEDVLLRCLAKDPGDRPADAGELREALLNCEAADGWTAADARDWWSEFAAGLSGSLPGDEDIPMSRTGLVVDLDSRLLSVAGDRETAERS